MYAKINVYQTYWFCDGNIIRLFTSRVCREYKFEQFLIKCIKPSVFLSNLITLKCNNNQMTEENKQIWLV